MAKANPTIAPFPSHIDRDQFGHWLSGFTDGEATFCLCFVRNPLSFGGKAARVSFIIKLRDDDEAILGLIQSYWQCGTRSGHNRPPGSNRKRVAGLSVQRADDLSNIVVPHFMNFPLRAKKARDFLIWKQGVELFAEIRRRRMRSRPGHRGGLYAKWTEDELARFASLTQELKDVRRHPSLLPDWVQPPSPIRHPVSDEMMMRLPGFM